MIVENFLSNSLGVGLFLSYSPLPAPHPFLGFSCTATSTSLPDLTASTSPPPRSPYTGSALFLSQDQIENANDEAKTEADPGQDEGIAVMIGLKTASVTICIAMSVDGCPDQNAQPAQQRDSPWEEESVSFLHGEELEHKDQEGDNREDDGQDHEGLHRLEGIFISIRQGLIAVARGTIFPETYWSYSIIWNHPGIANGGNK